VFCAGAPDTPEIEAEVRAGVAELAQLRDNVYWVREMLPTEQIREIVSAADVFICPSVYEPLGIVNLEAMAAETAVVASDVGGIPEVVEDGVTGALVHYDPADTDAYEHALARAVNEVAGDRERAATMGRAGRARAIEDFSWAEIARQTVAIYSDVVAKHG
jgi:starch synthase